MAARRLLNEIAAHACVACLCGVSGMVGGALGGAARHLSFWKKVLTAAACAVRALARSNLHWSRPPGHALHSPALPLSVQAGGSRQNKLRRCLGL